MKRNVPVVVMVLTLSLLMLVFTDSVVAQSYNNSCQLTSPTNSTLYPTNAGRYLIHLYTGIEAYLYNPSTTALSIQLWNTINCVNSGAPIAVPTTSIANEVAVQYTFAKNPYNFNTAGTLTSDYVVWYSPVGNHVAYMQVNFTVGVGGVVTTSFGRLNNLTLTYPPVFVQGSTMLSAAINTVDGSLDVAVLDQESAPQSYGILDLFTVSNPNSATAIVAHGFTVVTPANQPYDQIEVDTNGHGSVVTVQGNEQIQGYGTEQIYVNDSQVYGGYTNPVYGYQSGNETSIVTLSGYNNTVPAGYSAGYVAGWLDTVGNLNYVYESSDMPITIFRGPVEAAGYYTLNLFNIAQGAFGSISTASDGYIYVQTYGSHGYGSLAPSLLFEQKLLLFPLGNTGVTFSASNCYLTIDSQTVSSLGLTTLVFGVWNNAAKTFSFYVYPLPNHNSQTFQSTSYTYTTSSSTTYYSYIATSSSFVSIVTQITTYTTQYVSTAPFQSDMILIIIWLLLPTFIVAVFLGLFGFLCGMILGAWAGNLFGPIPLWMSVVITMTVAIIFLINRDSEHLWGGLLGNMMSGEGV